ncbi:MAG: hypothetical protein ACXVBL_19330 [Bdellovibrionota bacterium]
MRFHSTVGMTLLFIVLMQFYCPIGQACSGSGPEPLSNSAIDGFLKEKLIFIGKITKVQTTKISEGDFEDNFTISVQKVFRGSPKPTVELKLPRSTAPSLCPNFSPSVGESYLIHQGIRFPSFGVMAEPGTKRTISMYEEITKGHPSDDVIRERFAPIILKAQQDFEKNVEEDRAYRLKEQNDYFLKQRSKPKTH